MPSAPEPWRVRRLTELGLNTAPHREPLQNALSMAAADVRMCTDLDAPAMRGITFWSRTNRYLAEALTPHGWRYTTRDSILRTIHPARSHAITALSAAGGVGNLDAKVRSKNPKGPRMARLVERNGQYVLATIDEILYGRELDDIPVWCLLYKRDRTGLKAELSMPIKMNGKYVDEWQERIPLPMNGIGDPGADINLLDSPDDNDGPDVPVELLG